MREILFYVISSYSEICLTFNVIFILFELDMGPWRFSGSSFLTKGEFSMYDLPIL